MSQKRVIIIGAGVAGMSAAIYALDNHYDVTIYEKNPVVGGQCTGWMRNGVYIDGCAHWIVGTNPNSLLYPLWEHVGAFNEKSIIHETEYFAKYDIDGEIFTFYADLEKLENEMNRVAPIDKKMTAKFIKGIKKYFHCNIPTKKPLDCMNVFEFMAFGLKMLPMALHFLIFKKTSITKYAKKFKSPILQEVFSRVLGGYYNVHSLFYVMQSLANKNAGVVEGGSIKLINNMKNEVIRRGGTIICNTPVSKILVTDNKATGILLENGKIIEADYVISATDAHHTLYDLLDNKYQDSYFEKRFKNKIDNPLNDGILLSYKVKKDVSSFAKMTNFSINPLTIGPNIYKNISIRNHSFDKSINAKDTTFTCLLDCSEAMYDYFKSLNNEAYYSKKEEIGLAILKEIKRYFNLVDEDIELIDVTTPLTYERYTNAYKGSYMSFITTAKSKGLMRPGKIKNLKHFYLAGQWIMSPGGLPIALFSGKHAAYRICKEDRCLFLDLDKKLKEA